jgi:hypothetical protein
MKYDRIGIGYDTTRRADPRIAERLLALLQPAPADSTSTSVAAQATTPMRCIAKVSTSSESTNPMTAGYVRLCL